MIVAFYYDELIVLGGLRVKYRARLTRFNVDVAARTMKHGFFVSPRFASLCRIPCVEAFRMGFVQPATVGALALSLACGT